MYFDKRVGRADYDVEPFSLKALAISKMKTSLISKVTPILFEDGQDVKLRRVYKNILDEFKTKSKYKKYFSVWTVVGASWNIREGCYYYMIRNRFSVFVWVTAEQIEKAGVQKQIAEGPTRYPTGRPPPRGPDWQPGQQSLDPNVTDWRAQNCEYVMHVRLKHRK